MDNSDDSDDDGGGGDASMMLRQLQCIHRALTKVKSNCKFQEKFLSETQSFL